MIMTNEELIACIEAEKRGEKTECRQYDGTIWMWKMHSGWNTQVYEYRIAPKPEPKLVQHWPAISLIDGQPYLSDCLFHDEQSARDFLPDFLRLAVEYPPIMLEVKV